MANDEGLERAQENRDQLADPKQPKKLRDQLQRLVLADLLGPANGPEEEVDETRVSDRYLVGMLAPLKQRVGAETEDELAKGGAGSSEEGSTEPSTTPTDSMFPSSLGLTFTVARDVQSLRLTAHWGRYERADSETLETEKGNPKKIWKRVPMGGSVDLPLQPGDFRPVAPCDEQPEVKLQGLVRQRDDDWTVTVFLVNGQEEPDRLKDERWIFQPELVVEAPDGAPVFVRRKLPRDEGRWDPELLRETRELEMLYRRNVEFAVGHGVSVHAETAPDDPWRAIRLETRVAPSWEVAQQTPPTPEDPGFGELSNLVLDMKALAETPGGEFSVKLGALAEAYAAWIRREKERISRPEEGLAEHREPAEGAIGKCERALERIRAGAALLDDPERPEVAAAFRFANRAMALQRVRSIYAERRRRGNEADLEALDADVANHSWRPFQLAFILLNLPSATDLHHPDRSHETEALADLLWFPTGGGKTEAYLGLAAYAMALRRLQDPIEGRVGEHGVAVIMRYTLRLLTLQQFQRAAALVCACEAIRRDDEETWGGNPFRIGLWVGMRATPNTTEQAAEAVQQARGQWTKGQTGGAVGSPAQLTNCPWCGSKIDPGRDIEVELFGSGRSRTLTYCGDKLGRCLFGRRRSPKEGLPVVVVDEEIYRLLPALVIATVDKFAQMPWNGRTQMLFGQVDGFCPRHGFRSPEVEDSDSHPKRKGMPAVKTVPFGPLRPPDLIIQDELHLISGPLGSLVGLYETAVDELCSWIVDGKRVRPKVVASTATIRNALAQVNSLFLRKVEIFPPPGTSVEDNFFSIQRPVEDRFGRLYLGICAPGKRLKAVLIRVYVAYLGAAQLLYDKYGKDADPWMTLVGYFNSIRELGGMRRLVDDDVRTRLRRISIRGLGDRKPPIVEELTSRKGSADIPEVLDRLEVEFDPRDEEIRRELRKQRRPPQKPPPYDVLLATNMVSVGIDVQRLGLMVVGGQPKATAEYIQATSRVGRRQPGVVCTVYNWARPRDLSHYERFEHYHATFYQQVESLSVTPFAARALDRALSGLLVSLVRLAGDDFNENSRAAAIQREHAYVKRAIDAIGRRAALLAYDRDFGEEVRAMLQQRLDAWLARAGSTGGTNLAYKARRDGVTVPLLEAPSESGWDTFTCLNSLRDVEPVAGLVLVDDGLSGDVGKG